MTYETDLEFTPVSWLCSCVDLAGKEFKIVRQGVDYVEILHTSSGALWRFKSEILRGPA